MRYLTLLLALVCVACGSYSSNVPSIKPYKMDIQQGNVVTPKMMMQLRPGMTKSQVRFIMGTPLLTDSFHGDRWDYFYQMRKDGKILEQRRVILQFDGDALAHVTGDVIPAGSDSSGVPASPTGKTISEPKSVSKPAKEKEKGLLDKLKFWGDDEDGAPKALPKPAEETKPKAKAEPKTESGTAPAVEPEQANEPEEKQENLPPLMDESMQAKPEESRPVAPQEQPKKTSAPQEENKGLLNKLKFWGDDDKVEPKRAPDQKAAPAAKPVEPPKAEPAGVEPKPRAPAPVEKPSAPKPRPQTESKPKASPQPQVKAPPQPAADLPPEESPDFFEKMLEKIGF